MDGGQIENVKVSNWLAAILVSLVLSAQIAVGVWLLAGGEWGLLAIDAVMAVHNAVLLWFVMPRANA